VGLFPVALILIPKSVLKKRETIIQKSIIRIKRQMHIHISCAIPGLNLSRKAIKLGRLSKGIFDLPIMWRLIEYNPVITRIPARRPLILRRVWIKAVKLPATAPITKEASTAMKGLTPETMSTAVIAAPAVKLPSTVISGKLYMRNVIKTPVAMKA